MQHLNELFSAIIRIILFDNYIDENYMDNQNTYNYKNLTEI
jgi:hypothetical protein